MPAQRHVIRRSKLPQEAVELPGWVLGAALSVTAALAAAAATLVLRGPAQWLTIVLIPAVCLLLARLPRPGGKRPLRRTFQLAALVSLSVHLLLVLLTALTSVFGSRSPFQPERTISRRPRPAILTSRPRPEPLWEQIDRRDVVDPSIDTSRSATTPETETSPVLVENLEQRADPQVSRRSSQPEPSTARLGETLSQRRRSETGSVPESASVAAAASRSTVAHSAHAASASDAVSGQRQQAEPDASATASGPAGSTTGQTGPASPANTPRRAAPDSPGQIADLPERNARSAAPLRSARPEVATAQTAGAAASATRGTTPAPADPGELAPAPRPASSRQVDNVPLSSPAASSAAELTRQTVAGQPRRSATEQDAAPSITDPDAAATLPRRSRLQSRTESTVRPAELPSMAEQPARQTGESPQPAATSINRAEPLGAMAGTSQSFAPDANQSSGAASSSSAVQRRTDRSSVPAAAELLTSRQRSASSDLRSTAPSSSSAAPANTLRPASIAGNERRGERTESAVESPTASATRDPAATMAAEPGTSALDSQAPARQVAETPRNTSGGGGSPETGSLQPLDTGSRRTRSHSDVAQLDAPVADITGSERMPSASPARGQSAPAESPSGASGRQETAAGDTELPTGSAESAETPGGAPSLPRRSDRGESGSADTRLAGSSPAGDASQPRQGSRNNGRMSAPAVAAETNLGSASQRVPASTPAPSEGQGDERTGALADNRLRETGPASPTASGDAEAANPAAASRRDSRTEGRADSRDTGERESRASSRSGIRSGPTGEMAELNSPASGERSAANQVPAADSMPSQRVGEGLELDIRADQGATGLGDLPAERLGTEVRPAARDGQSIQFELPSRFARDNPGSLPSTRADAALARRAFQSRQSASRSPPETEAAIELGLEFLARYQQPDGSWALEIFDQGHPLHGQQIVSHTAATGLAVLAFQGAGYHHRDFRYAAVLDRAIHWLIEHQQENGDLYVPSDERSGQSARIYSHAIATLALTEAWGMTQDPELRLPSQRAVEFLTGTQDPLRGGWRYFTEAGRRSSDTSVTGWVVMALQSARLGGIPVPDACWRGVKEWMAVAHDPASPQRFRYDPFARDDAQYRRAQQRLATPSMTAVGLLVQLYLEGAPAATSLRGGGEWLLATPPSAGSQAERDTYYWYYATQVLRHAGGAQWQRWNERLHPLLTGTQVQTGPLAGSWDPYLPVPDRWGSFGGRLYVTTMNLLSLEVDYRLLPLYQEQ